jgi:hypothetical protein
VVLVAISTPPQRPSALALVLQINPISTASDNATGHRVLFRINTVVSMGNVRRSSRNAM